MRILMATGSLLLALLAAMAPAAHARATVTGADTPDAATLLKQARSSYLQAGSAHVVVHVDAALSGTKSGAVAEQLEGDMAWRAPIQAQLTGTTSIQAGAIPIGVPVLTLEIRYVQKTLAVQIQGKPWTCVNSKALLPTNISPAGMTAVPGTKTTMKKVVMVGPDTLNGVAVWHVRQSGSTATKSMKKTVKVATSADTYISQSGNTIVRIGTSATITMGKQAIHESSTVDFSNYGESVSVALPAACGAAGGANRVSASLPVHLVRPDAHARIGPGLLIA